jgi:hypothetical protein
MEPDDGHLEWLNRLSEVMDQPTLRHGLSLDLMREALTAAGATADGADRGYLRLVAGQAYLSACCSTLELKLDGLHRRLDVAEGFGMALHRLEQLGDGESVRVLRAQVLGLDE